MRLFSRISARKLPSSRRRRVSRHSRNALPLATMLAGVEPLETRMFLSAVAWTGAGNDLNWNDAANWSSGAVPGASDDVTIDVPGNITIGGASGSINSLTSGDGISVDGGTLSIAAASTVASLTLNSGELAGDGVLGCYNGANSEITLLQGWNWYAGADASQIGSDQYDFQTTVTHEIGHALGLGGASDSNSPMYESLAEGVAHRAVSVADLNIPEPPEGADPQMAAGFAENEDDRGHTASAGIAVIASDASGQKAGASLLAHDAAVAWKQPDNDAVKLTAVRDQVWAAWNDDLLDTDLFGS